LNGGTEELPNRIRAQRIKIKRPTPAKFGPMWGTVKKRTQMWATSPPTRPNAEADHEGRLAKISTTVDSVPAVRSPET
jgi:hypothetical protein